MNIAFLEDSRSRGAKLLGITALTLGLMFFVAAVVPVFVAARLSLVRLLPGAAALDTAAAGRKVFALDVSAAAVLLLLAAFFLLPGKRLGKLLSALTLLFILATVFFILCNADFELGDDIELLTSICQKKPFSMLAYAGVGRFNWSRSEYNLLLLTPFYASPLAFYAISSMQFIVFSLFTLLLLRLYIPQDWTRNKEGAFFLFGVWLLLAIFAEEPFFCLVQPESLLLALMAPFMYFLLKAVKHGGGYYLASLLLAFPTTYCKEPLFGAFLVIAAYILLFLRSNKKAALFAIGLIIDATIYVVLYGLLILPKIVERYGKTEISYLGAATQILQRTPLLALLLPFAAAVLAKLVLGVARGKGYAPCIEDALLLSAAAYALALFLLRLTKHTYFYPCFMLAFPAVLLYGRKGTEACGPSIRLAATALCYLLCAYYMHYYVITAAHKVLEGHQEMEDMRLIASLADGESSFYWYDKENFTDETVNWKSNVLPGFINYINGTDDFHITRTSELPSELPPNTYILSWDRIPGEALSGCTELPVPLLHLYRWNGAVQ